MKLEAMAVAMPLVKDHPNRVPFDGVLTYVDVPSDRAPSGSRGRRVILTHAAADAALPSLLGMAVDFCPGWDGHDARRKCGIITDAEIVSSHGASRGGSSEIRVAGYLFGRDFPEVERHLRSTPAEQMGMSYELADAHVEDMRASVWRLTKVTFTGAAILLREKAAYGRTSFRLSGGRVRHGATNDLTRPLAARRA
jgi:hypothetical protein